MFTGVDLSDNPLCDLCATEQTASHSVKSPARDKTTFWPFIVHETAKSVDSAILIIVMHNHCGGNVYSVRSATGQA